MSDSTSLYLFDDVEPSDNECEEISIKDDFKREDKSQCTLFEMGEWWEDDWQGMPEFVQEDQSPYASIMVHFQSHKDMEEFSKKIGQKIYKTTKCIWIPEAKIKRYANKRYVIDHYNKKK